MHAWHAAECQIAMGYESLKHQSEKEMQLINYMSEAAIFTQQTNVRACVHARTMHTDRLPETELTSLNNCIPINNTSQKLPHGNSICM